MINKILVVDDSVAVHHIYKMMLTRYKCDVISAFSGPEGLKRLSEHSDVNLMIVDSNMPRVSGIEFIKKVKEQEVFNDIPIIFVSFEGNEEVKGAVAITQGFLRKPFTSNELHSLIENLFSAGRSTRNPPVN